MKIFLAIAAGMATGASAGDYGDAGVTVAKNRSFISLGESSDVVLSRTGDAELTVTGYVMFNDTVAVTNDVMYPTNSGTNGLTDLHDQVQSLDDDLLGLSDDVSNLTSTLSDVADAVDTVSSAADGVADDLSALDDTVSGIADDVTALQNAATALDAGLDVVNGTALSAEAAASTANSAIDSLSADVDDLIDVVDGLLSNVSVVSSSVSAKPRRIDQAMKEGYCSRQNCCNEEAEWVDGSTLHCWSASYDDYESDPCSCAVYFTEKNTDWSWHDRYCTNVLGGHLFSIHSSTAASLIADFSTTSASIFVGLHDYLDEDAWMNTDGTPANWLGWNTGEPNDSNGEDCAELYPSTEKLNDIDCDTAYSNRKASACTVFEPVAKDVDTTMDKVLAEARCSRVNCCHESYEWVDSDTLHCWSNSYSFFEEDPCSCVVEFTDMTGSWKDHEKYCQETHGGQLFSIHSGNAAARLVEFETDSYSVYIGLHDYHTEDDWFNSDGTPANWLGWNSGEPNDSSGEDCAEIYFTTTGLNDIGCDTVYSTRFASACTYFSAQRNQRDVTEDAAEQEARCSRINCCNEETAWIDGDTLKCWNSEYFSWKADPCACTVEFVEKQTTWTWHEQYCVESLGGQLMSIHTDTAAAAIADFDTSSYSVFVGTHDYLDEDDWMNTDGTPANWLGWNSGEPNDSNGEDCVEIYPSTGGFNDIGCDTSYSGRYASACLLMGQQ